MRIRAFLMAVLVAGLAVLPAGCVDANGNPTQVSVDSNGNRLDANGNPAKG